MSAPSKTPPRFVPTLTDVVPVDAVQAPATELPAVAVSEPPVSDEADSWTNEGMLAPRRGVVSMPASLPPLPHDLAPQRPMVADLAPLEERPLPAAQTAHSDYLPPSAPSVEMQLAQESRLAEMDDVVPAEEPVPAHELVPAERVVQSVAEPVVEPAPASSALPASASPTMESIWDSHAQQVTEEYLVHRLMQRVDLVLDQRLRDAIATVVQQQTRSIVVRLREEVESVVRQAVYEAVADELAHRADAARGDGSRGSR